MWAVVIEPSGTLPDTVKLTWARPCSSATSDTDPTVTPAIFTSLPGIRPPASAKVAW